MKKRTVKKLALNKESILRLNPSEMGEIVGGATNLCTNTNDCTDSCQQSCFCATRRVICA